MKEQNDLKPSEKHIVQVLVAELRERKGMKLAITADDLLYFLRRKGYPSNMQRLLVYIAYIRQNSLLRGLIFTERGFYLASSYTELIAYDVRLRNESRAIRELCSEVERNYINGKEQH